MADKMMRIAGRTPSGTAVPMAADASGNVSVTRTWKKEWVALQTSLEIRDTNAHNIPAFDVSGIPMYSLRILNRLGVPVTITFLADVNTTNGYALTDIDMVTKAITVQPGQSYIIITPDDLPLLNYIRYLRMLVKASSTPEAGVFEAYVVTIK